MSHSWQGWERVQGGEVMVTACRTCLSLAPGTSSSIAGAAVDTPGGARSECGDMRERGDGLGRWDLLLLGSGDLVIHLRGGGGVLGGHSGGGEVGMWDLGEE